MQYERNMPNCKKIWSKSHRRCGACFSKPYKNRLRRHNRRCRSFFILRYKDNNNRGRRNGLHTRQENCRKNDGNAPARNGQDNMGPLHFSARELGIRHYCPWIQIQPAGHSCGYRSTTAETGRRFLRKTNKNRKKIQRSVQPA